MRYKVTGEGEPVILVHGLSGSSLWWTRNLPALAEQYRVYLVDLPGFGAMRGHQAGFVVTEAASWLGAWLDAVGLRQAHLVGHSMGGYICLRLAADVPHAVQRLVLAAPAGVPTGRSMLGNVIALLKSARYTTLSFLPLIAYDALRAGPLALWRAARDLLAENVRQHLERVAAPTLLIWGESDMLVPPSLGQVMRQTIPSARLLILQGAGHVPMFDRPEEFNAAILAFLAGGIVGE